MVLFHKNLNRIYPIYTLKKTNLISLLSFSTAETLNPSPKPHFMEEFLINSCGLSSDKAAKASKQLTHLRSSSNPNSILQFLRQCGITDTDIGSFIYRRPDFLCFNVEKTLKPKLKSLEGLGFSETDLASLLFHNPNLLCYHNLRPKIEFLKSILGTDIENMLKAFSKDYSLLGCSLTKRLMPNVAHLRECGVPDCRIAKLMTQNRGVVTRSPSEVENMTRWVEELGIPRHTTMFWHVFRTLVCFNKATFGARFEFWKSLGLSEEEFLAAFRKHPSFVHISEDNARGKVDFLLKEVGCEFSYLTRRPMMFTYSLEKRLVPRCLVLRVLKREELLGKSRDLLNAITISGEKFLEKFVVPNKEKLPKLLEAYLAACAGNVPDLQSIQPAKEK